MTEFNPGEGFREAQESEAFPAGTRVIREQIIGQRGYEHVWVHEEPVPPLPTEPYTVIRVTWAAAKEPGVLILAAAHRWASLGGDGYRPEFVAGQISDFEVLAKPVKDL